MEKGHKKQNTCYLMHSTDGFILVHCCFFHHYAFSVHQDQVCLIYELSYQVNFAGKLNTEDKANIVYHNF